MAGKHQSSKSSPELLLTLGSSAEKLGPDFDVLSPGQHQIPLITTLSSA